MNRLFRLFPEACIEVSALLCSVFRCWNDLHLGRRRGGKDRQPCHLPQNPRCIQFPTRARSTARLTAASQLVRAEQSPSPPPLRTSRHPLGQEKLQDDLTSFAEDYHERVLKGLALAAEPYAEEEEEEEGKGDQEVDAQEPQQEAEEEAEEQWGAAKIMADGVIDVTPMEKKTVKHVALKHVALKHVALKHVALKHVVLKHVVLSSTMGVVVCSLPSMACFFLLFRLVVPPCCSTKLARTRCFDYRNQKDRRHHHHQQQQQPIFPLKFRSGALRTPPPLPPPRRQRRHTLRLGCVKKYTKLVESIDLASPTGALWFVLFSFPAVLSRTVAPPPCLLPSVTSPVPPLFAGDFLRVIPTCIACGGTPRVSHAGKSHV